MIYEKLTASGAVLHFERHRFKAAFDGRPRKGNKEYFTAYQTIQAAKRGKVTDARARALLEKHGGNMYRCVSYFEVAVNETGNRADFKQELESVNDKTNTPQ